jgi:hypothetical protein
MATPEQLPQSIFLYFTGQGSGKFYQVHLHLKDDGWVVDYGTLVEVRLLQAVLGFLRRVCAEGD